MGASLENLPESEAGFGITDRGIIALFRFPNDNVSDFILSI